MAPLHDWMVFAAVGSTFALLGSIRLYGLWRGIVGGRDKPVMQRLCGTRPTWTSRSSRLALLLLFPAIGLGELACLAWTTFDNSQGI